MSALATRYAESLFSLALDNDKVSLYKEQIDLVKKSFNDANVLPFFGSSKVSKEEKKELIKNIFNGKLDRYVVNFLYVLVDRGRMVNYKEIFSEFHHLCNESLGIKEGTIETARPLKVELIEELENALSKDGERIELIEVINKSLISGFKISIDNRVIDNSMKQRIQNMEETLKRKDGNLWN